MLLAPRRRPCVLLLHMLPLSLLPLENPPRQMFEEELCFAVWFHVKIDLKNHNIGPLWIGRIEDY